MNYLFFIPTLTVVLILFFGAHYGIYAFLVQFFPAHILKPLAWLLAFFSVSFFIASIAAHWIDNLLSRAFYFASGIWLGTMINLLLAIFSTAVVLWIVRMTPLNISESMIAGSFLAIACIMSIYGVWNAMHPRIQNISVTIPKLPDAWRGQKLVQISDVHLGHIYRAPFLKQVVEMINKENPKLVVITGDLFDGMDGGLPELVEPLNDLNAPKGVLFVGGNHETYLGTQKSLDVLTQTKIHILQDEVVDVDGIAFIGISYPERGEEKDVVEIIQSLGDRIAQKPSILLYHAPKMIAEVAKTGIHLQLSGHTHQGQQFPFQFITHLVHKGYDYGLYTLGNYSLYTSSGVGTWGPPMRIGTQSEIVVITLQ